MKRNDDIDVRLADVERIKAGLGAKVAPAVALLLVGERAFADTEDLAHIPEPTTLSLMAISAAGAAAAAGLNKRRKK